VGFTIGLLVNRAPREREAVPATAGGSGRVDHADEPEVKEPPLWQQLFRPGPVTARQILRMGLPFLRLSDRSTSSVERRTLVAYMTGQASERPQNLFQTILPFLQSQSEVVVQPPPRPGEKPPADSQPPVRPPDSPGPGGASKPPGPSQPPATPRSEPPAAAVGNGLPVIGIYHTHDWESYISEFPGLQLRSDDDLRKISSEDHKRKTVMDIGRSVGARLQQLGVASVFAPYTHTDYDLAYIYSRSTAKEILKAFPSVKVLLDLHRDSGVFDPSRPPGQRTAQIRCIIGIKDQPHWEKNLAFCESLVQRLEKKHPGITLPTRKQQYTYNQDLLPGAILLEIGDALNQYAGAERSALLLADVLAEMVREGAFPH
jgi:stage II sporulation protein P